MNEQFKITLNGTELVTLPDGLDSAELVLRRDDTLKGLFLTYIENLVFTGDGFTFLETIYNADGYCTDVDVEVLFAASENNYQLLFQGIVRLSEVKFNLSKSTAEASIEDRSFYALILNNRNIKFPVNTNLSKNAVSITAMTSRLISPLDSNDQSYETGHKFVVWDVKEVFRVLVASMTDNVINVVNSDWYDALDDADKLGIATGEAIRTASTSLAPEVSFQQMFTELSRKFNLGMALEKQTNGAYELRIEPESYFYNANISPVKLNIVAELTREVDTTQMYANIKLGSNITEYDGGIYKNLPSIRLLGFKQEEFYIGGQCNTDLALDTQNADFIIDHNTINDLVMVSTDTSFDDSIFLIQHEAVGLLASYWTIAGVTGWFYNEELRNDQVLERFEFQGVVAKYVNTDDTCHIVKTNSQTGNINYGVVVPIPSWIYYATEEPITLQTETLDPSNRWTSNTTYTASSDGIYYFDCSAAISSNCNTFSTLNDYGAGKFVRVQAVIQLLRYDSGNVLIDTINLGTFSLDTYEYTQTLSTTISGTGQVIMEATDYVQMAVYIETVALLGILSPSGDLSYFVASTPGDQYQFLNIDIDYEVNPTTYFKCVGSTNGGGIFKESTQTDYKTSLYRCEYPLSLTNFNNWVDFPTNTILFNYRANQAYREAWIKEVRYKLKGGKTTINLISNT